MQFIAANKPFSAVLVLLFVALLEGCTSAGAPAASVALPDVEIALQVVEEEELVTDDVQATEDGLTEEASVDECLRCHTDKEMLITSAAPEEVVISENEGEG